MKHIKRFFKGYLAMVGRIIVTNSFRNEKEQVLQWYILRMARYKDFIEIDIDDGVEGIEKLDPKDYNRLLFDILNAKLGAVALPVYLLLVLTIFMPTLATISIPLAIMTMIWGYPIEKYRNGLKMNIVDLEERCMGILDSERA
ncbi:MAG: hypothetical protein LBV09_03360 [Deferribacteraceae bacterium]|nr:hypothetical protein [Deferribacteraceae bacterium]